MKSQTYSYCFSSKCIIYEIYISGKNIFGVILNVTTTNIIAENDWFQHYLLDAVRSSRNCIQIKLKCQNFFDILVQNYVVLVLYETLVCQVVLIFCCFCCLCLSITASLLIPVNISPSITFELFSLNMLCVLFGFKLIVFDSIVVYCCCYFKDNFRILF